MTDYKLRITFGGWYQRTTLHLSEIYAFLSEAETKLALDREKLKKLKRELSLRSVSREAGDLELVRAQAGHGLEIRYYEDGLYVLETTAKNLVDVKEKAQYLSQFFESKFSPAIAYIFSLGAPTPKILANLKIDHPVVVSTVVDDPTSFALDPKDFGQTYSRISGQGVTVHKTPHYIFVCGQPGAEAGLQKLAETQIFFREFKDQLERYLDIHRKIWEEIASVKERKSIKGSEVALVRASLDAYQKTVDLIDSRLNQMGTYINTRRSLAKSLRLEESLLTLFQYKFETLSDTHVYIKEIWKMTKNYLDNAIRVIVEIQNQTTNTSIQSLRTITTIGVVASISLWLSRETLPSLTMVGLIYLIILVVVTWSVNKLVNFLYQNRRYKITFSERKEDI